MREGLIWGNDYREVPIAYGIFKLQIGCVITDSIYIDELIDEMVTIKGMIEQDDGEEEEGNSFKKHKRAKITVEDYLVQSVDTLRVSKV